MAIAGKSQESLFLRRFIFKWVDFSIVILVYWRVEKFHLPLVKGGSVTKYVQNRLLIRPIGGSVELSL